MEHFSPMQRIHTQRLPLLRISGWTDTKLSLNRRKPTPEYIELFDEPERSEVIEIMQESLVYSMAAAQDVRTPLILQPDYPECYRPHPGRCLWTWETLRKLDEPLDVGPLRNLSLRPSTRVADHLKRVSPRLAWMMTTMKFSELHRCMQQVQEEASEDDPQSYHVLHRTMMTFTYEASVRRDEKRTNYLAMPEVERAPANSRRNIYQQYVLSLPATGRGGVIRPDKANHKPVGPLVAKNPPYPADLAPTTRSLFKDAQERADKLLAELARVPQDEDRDDPLPKVDKLREQMDDPKVQAHAVYQFLHGSWLLIIDSMVDPKMPYAVRAAALLSYAMMVVQCHVRYRRYLSTLKAADMLSLSKMTGLPPSVFVNYCMDHYHRCGYLPVTENQIHLMMEMIQRYNIPATRVALRGSREDLLDELRQQAATIAMWDTDPRIQRMIDYGDIPEWGIELDGGLEDVD